MPASTSATPRPSWTALLCFLAISVVAIALGSPKQLTGFVLDGGLNVTAEDVPGDAVRTGDAVVSVAGSDVTTIGELGSALRGTGAGASAEVVVEQRARFAEITLTPGRLDGALPDELREASSVVSVDGEALSGTLSLEELRARAERASPEPVVVTVERPAERVSAPVVVRRASPPALALSWLAMTLLVLLVSLVMRSERVDRLGGPDLLGVGALCAGGVAAFGASTIALDPAGSHLLLALTVAFAVAAQGLVSLDAFAGEVRGRASAWLVVIAISVAAGASALGLADGAQASWWLAAALVAGLAASRVIVARGAPLWVKFADAGAGLAAAAALGAAALGLEASGVAALFTVAVATTWARVVPDALGADGRGARAPSGRGAALHEALAALQAEVHPAEACLLVGGEGAWVELSASAERERTSVAPASAEWSAAMGMLAVEGGGFPRSSGDGDGPFDGWPEKLGIVAALPVHRRGDALTAFVVVREREAGSAPQASLDEAIATAPALEAARMEWLAAAALGLSGNDGAPEARREPAATATSASPEVVREVVHVRDPDAEARTALLEREISLLQPVDDPEALTDRERSALRFLAVDAQPALLVGEPQVGKAFLARAIHALSPRGDEAFVTFDVGVTPRALVLPLLIGDDEEPGLLAAAEDGTLLLKSPSLLDAAALKTVLEAVAASGVRVIFAERYVGDEEGVPSSLPAGIREAVGSRNLHVRPLRERPSDVRRFALWFAHRAAMGLGHARVDFSEDAYEALEACPWEGNFDELRALVRRAVFRAAGDVITVGHLGLEPQAARAPAASSAAAGAGWTRAENAERETIARVLQKHDGNRTRAAKELGITRGKLLRRLKKFGLD